MINFSPSYPLHNQITANNAPRFWPPYSCC